jgi:hypothetical protein
MYRYLFYGLRLFAAWPLLLMLITAIGGMQWYRQNNEKSLAVEKLLSDVFEVQQAYKKEEAVFDGIAFKDLQRRAQIKAGDFLAVDAVNDAYLQAQLAPALADHGWTLNTCQLLAFDQPAKSNQLASVYVEAAALMPIQSWDANTEMEQGTRPLLASLRAIKQLWQTVPTKGMTQIAIERTDSFYALKLGVFMPAYQDLNAMGTLLEN